MVQSRKKVAVPRDDIQPNHKDLDRALVADEQNFISQIWQAKPLPRSDWTTGLAACALRGVDMRPPGATEAAHPESFSAGDAFAPSKATNPNSSVSAPSVKKNRSRPASSPSALCQLVEGPCFSSWVTYKTKTRYTQLHCSHTCLPLIRHTSTLDFQHQQWATMST